MNIVVIFNGLGNQMSQYAFYLSKRNISSNCHVIFDSASKNRHNGSELDRLFGVNYDNGIKGLFLKFMLRVALHPFLNQLKIPQLLRIKVVREPSNYDYNPLLFDLSESERGLCYYIGGWHSEKNFISVKDEIKSIFTFPETDDERCISFIDLIKSSPNSVSLHVRRGDYVNIDPNDFYQFGGVSTLEYYQKAIRRMTEEVGKCTFFIFSNDLDWCKQEFKDLDAYYVDCNSGRNSWRDMYLMTLCKHHINANSTFSWWGAWLAEQNGITICPQKFLRTIETKDIYPESWIKIESE